MRRIHQVSSALLGLAFSTALLGACSDDEDSTPGGMAGNAGSSAGTAGSSGASGSSGRGGSAGTGGTGGTAGSSGTGGTAGSSGTGGTTGTGGTAGTGGTGGTGSTETLCAKYGGAANVATVISTKVIPEIAGDCRINTFFTSLSTAGLNHVVECLSIQAQELFSCPGITYAGSRDSAGVACRSMTEAHRGLGISKGDFDALITDVVAGLTEAGVAQADIQMAAPALLGLEGAIVENDSTSNSKAACDGGTDGG
jgi:hypothetical protein